MKTTTAIAFSTLITVGSGFLIVPDMAGAEGFGPMNMMNPSRWFGGGDRDYDDPYYADRGYGPPPPGYGPPPMGAPGYGYAPPPPIGGYGYTPPTAAPGYTAPASTPTTTTSGVDSQTRIRELEDEKARAERARRRFEARNERLQREQRERETELARQKETARKAGPDAIAEIMKRKQQDDGD